jgi:homoserine kinase type II
VALLTALSLGDARRLGRTYGVELTRIDALSVGSVNSNFRATSSDGRTLFARLYEEQGQSGAEGELALLEGLAAESIPVSRPLPHTGPVPTLGDKPFAVFPWVDGEILCLGRVTLDAARRVGRALAQVHLASPNLPRLGPGRFGPPDMLERLARVERENARPALLPEVARVRELYAR